MMKTTKQHQITMNNDDIKQLMISICNLHKKLDEIKESRSKPKIYTNEDIRKILKVEDKLIRAYREEGSLPYHRSGNKYWYTNDDIEQFLANTHYNNCPRVS